MINQIQLFILLPLLGAYIHTDVIKFFRYFDNILISFWFIPKSHVYIGYDETFGKFDFEQPNWYLYLINYESGSTLYNIGKFIWVLMYITVTYSVVLLAYLLTKATCSNSLVHRGFKIAKKWMTFSLFIRLFMLSYTFLYLGALSEIVITNDNIEHTQSYTIAVVIAVLCFGFLTFAFVQWLYARNADRFSKMEYFKEFFRGLKPNDCSRLYPVLWLMRNLLVVTAIVLLKDQSMYYSISIVVGLQALFLIYLAVIIPFK